MRRETAEVAVGVTDVENRCLGILARREGRAVAARFAFGDDAALDDLRLDPHHLTDVAFCLDARNAAVERYNTRLDHMVGREWLLGGLLVYSLIDAYVDAHFVNFRFEFEHDSARPEGVRLGLEKRF